MIALVRAEILKIRSVRSTLIMLFVVVGLCLVPAVLISLLVGADDLAVMEPHDKASVLLVGVLLSETMLAVLAALVITGEYRFGTIRTTFLGEPRRVRVFLAKLVTVIGLSAVMATVMVTVTIGVGSLILNARDVGLVLGSGQVPRLLYGTVLYAIVYAVIALGLGTVLRNSAASIVLIIVIPWIVENIVAGILSALHHGSWGRWLPFQAGQRITADVSGESVLGDRLSPWAGYGYCWLWAIAVCALGAWFLHHRDA